MLHFLDLLFAGVWVLLDVYWLTNCALQSSFVSTERIFQLIFLFLSLSLSLSRLESPVLDYLPTLTIGCR